MYLLLLLGFWASVRARPTIAAVTRRDIVVALPLRGQVAAPPLARAEVQAPYRARVARVYTSVGHRVSRGDVLVEVVHPTAEASSEDTLIRAPIGGTVLGLNARPGQEIDGDAREPVVTVVDLGALQVHARLSAEQAAPVWSGMPVWLTFRELPGQQFEGKVASIVSASDARLGAPPLLAVVQFENGDGLVKPGMKAEVAVVLAEERAVLAVPKAAVDRDSEGRPVVTVLRGGHWQSTVVETSLSDHHFTAIKSGLQEGETVQVRRGAS